MTRVAIGVNAALAVVKIALGIVRLSGFMIISALYSVGMMTAKAYIHAGLGDTGRRRGLHECFRIIGIVLLCPRRRVHDRLRKDPETWPFPRGQGGLLR